MWRPRSSELGIELVGKFPYSFAVSPNANELGGEAVQGLGD